MGYKKGEILRTAFDAFTIRGKKGEGGSGEIYEVSDSEGAAYAVKILDPAKATRSRLKRFRNEIHFCTKKVHPNVIQIHSAGITERGATFYVMPLYSRTLRDLILNGIAQKTVLTYFSGILDGVEAAHLLSVWHRDIKPENILFSQDTNSLVVADFGIAHFEEEELLTAVETKNHERLANFLYSAPEQKNRGHSVDSKADIYALGMLLNEMFTGAVPHGTAFRRISEVSPSHSYLDGLVDLMLRQNPTQRPSIADVKRELIARGNEFMSVQRLNSLRTEVIPETEVDDPIVRNPIISISADYRDGNLIFKLSAPPPPNWIMAFQNPRGSTSHYMRSGPAYVTFENGEARIALGRGMQPAQMQEYMHSYIDQANRQYSEMLLSSHRKKVAADRERLRKEIAEEERRKKILEELNRNI